MVHRLCEFTSIVSGSESLILLCKPSDRHALVGLKPTRGLTSRYGVIPFSEHLDSVGPMTRHVSDSAILLNALAGEKANEDLLGLAAYGNRCTQGQTRMIHGLSHSQQTSPITQQN
jgi:Asp-tRNA(Asn)/Glu-tRNA(Gln) amidotransferase A subunit family amidase